MAMIHNACEIMCLLRVPYLFTFTLIIMYCDNMFVIYIANNPIFHEITKYVEVDCFIIHNVILCKQIFTPFTN